MENLFRSIGSIAAAGAIFSPVPADKKGPVVATKDIAAVAAEELAASTPGHRIRGVHGAADLSGREQAAILSEALHQPIAYVEVPVEAAEQGMRDAGLPPFAVTLYGDMYRAILSGRMDSSEPRAPRPPRRRRSPSSPATWRARPSSRRCPSTSRFRASRARTWKS